MQTLAVVRVQADPPLPGGDEGCPMGDEGIPGSPGAARGRAEFRLMNTRVVVRPARGSGSARAARGRWAWGRGWRGWKRDSPSRTALAEAARF